MLKDTFPTIIFNEELHSISEVFQREAPFKIKTFQLEAGFLTTTNNIVTTPHIKLAKQSNSLGIMKRGNYLKGEVSLSLIQSEHTTTLIDTLHQQPHLLRNSLEDNKIDFLLAQGASTFYTIVLKEEFFKSHFESIFHQAFEAISQYHFMIESGKIAFFTKCFNQYLHSLSTEKPSKDQYPEQALMRDLFHFVELVPKETVKQNILARQIRCQLHRSLKKTRSITQIIDKLQISERQFYNVFKKYYGLSPKKYLLLMRLNSVRFALLHSNKEGNISDIAFQYGFRHMSRFAKEYFALFRIKPSQTLLQEYLAKKSSSF